MKKFLFLLIICFTMTGCVKTVTETHVKYVKPEIPEAVISPCDPMPTSQISTNGDLLMSYITLQSAYAVCASKVSSIRMIIQSYDDIYIEEQNQ